MGCSNSLENVADIDIFLEPQSHDTFAEKEYQIRGEKRNVVSWIPVSGNPKAIVLVSHGLHEHSLKYFEIAHRLTAKGFAVHGIDHVAHGKSAGVRGFIADHTVLSNDFIEFAKIIQSENQPNLPTFLLSHSAGTLVAILAAMSIPNLKAILFSACAIQVGPAAGSILGIRALYPISQWRSAERIVGFMAFVSPRGPGAPLAVRDITSDVASQEIIQRDPRTFHKDIRNKTGFEILKMTNTAKATLPALTLPFLCMHGELDEVTLPVGSVYLRDHAGTVEDRKGVRIIQGSRHEMFFEVAAVREEAFACVCEYFEQQLVLALAQSATTSEPSAVADSNLQVGADADADADAGVVKEAEEGTASAGATDDKVTSMTANVALSV